MGLVVGSKLLHMLHESFVTCLVGTWCFATAGMFQVIAVAPTPLPRVVEIEHRHHLTLFHLHQQVVKTCQDGVVIDPWRQLQGRFHLGGDAPLAIRAHQDA